MMRRLGKRGMEDKIWFLIFELIAFAMVTIVIMFAVKGLVDNSTYWKKYYSVDLGLMADLENINQGDFVMNYVLKPKNYAYGTTVFFLKDRKYDFVLQNDRIDVYDSPKDESKYPTTYPFAPSKNVKVQTNTVTADFLVLAKQKSVLTLDKYLVDNAAVCPSYDTAKDIKTLKFDSISADSTATQSTQFAASIKAILSGYNPKSMTTEATILVSYKKDSPMTIYYSDDMNTLKSQKLACLVGMDYSDKYPDNTYELKVYDGSLDKNVAFTNYISTLPNNPDQFWIILQLSDKEIAITQNTFAQVVKDALVKYYE